MKNNPKLICIKTFSILSLRHQKFVTHESMCNKFLFQILQKINSRFANCKYKINITKKIAQMNLIN